METVQNKDIWNLYSLFRSYLWGMETIVNTDVDREYFLVSILPMRHGNWKCPYLSVWEDRIVSILPMRHGNLERERYFDDYMKKFRSYLWGMETLILFFFSRFPLLVSILPMRHGNPFSYNMKKGSCSFVSILPMRHGNLKLYSSRNSLYQFRSYLWGMETT